MLEIRSFLHRLQALGCGSLLKRPGSSSRLLGAVFINFIYRLWLPLKRLAPGSLEPFLGVFTSSGSLHIFYWLQLPLIRPGSRFPAPALQHCMLLTYYYLIQNPPTKIQFLLIFFTHIYLFKNRKILYLKVETHKNKGNRKWECNVIYLHKANRTDLITFCINAGELTYHPPLTRHIQKHFKESFK